MVEMFQRLTIAVQQHSAAVQFLEHVAVASSPKT